MRTYHPDSIKGVLESKYKVYTDPNVKDGELLVGFKGTTPYDAGFFYAPYIPLQTDVMVNPTKEDLKKKHGRGYTGEARPLKAEWTMEAAEDLRALHGLDAEAELANILSTEILREINKEIVETIYKLAEEPEVTTTWDKAAGESETVWHFVEAAPSTEPMTIYTPFIAEEKQEEPTPHISFNNSEWFGILGEKHDYGLMVGRREEAPDVHRLRIALDVGDDG